MEENHWYIRSTKLDTTNCPMVHLISTSLLTVDQDQGTALRIQNMGKGSKLKVQGSEWISHIGIFCPNYQQRVSRDFMSWSLKRHSIFEVKSSLQRNSLRNFPILQLNRFHKSMLKNNETSCRTRIYIWQNFPEIGISGRTKICPWNSSPFWGWPISWLAVALSGMNC